MDAGTLSWGAVVVSVVGEHKSQKKTQHPLFTGGKMQTGGMNELEASPE